MLVSRLKVVVAIVLGLGLLATAATALMPLASVGGENRGEGVPARLVGEEKKQNEARDTIHGMWSLVSIESVRGTSPKTLTTTRQEPKGFTMTFDGKQVTHRQVGEDGKVQRATFKTTLDTQKQPHRLTVHTKDHSIRYIYEVKGDTLRLCCFPLAEEDGGGRRGKPGPPTRRVGFRVDSPAGGGGPGTRKGNRADRFQALLRTEARPETSG
jgi:uncharacterized protein (TIGR03067 family)